MSNYTEDVEMEESEEEETPKSKNSRKTKKKPTRRPKIRRFRFRFQSRGGQRVGTRQESSSSKDEPRARSKAKPKPKAASKGIKGAKGKLTPGTSREDELAAMLKTIVSKYGYLNSNLEHNPLNIFITRPKKITSADHASTRFLRS
eukprot:CAMPEP_0194352012 /NCGR_PEP_ID=MMETSP0174-20130528/387_1 /TAXON_ID=216777 /ORGANISM="Proboscia alata, Strain PI-D3" /LENGTH=145 /DNA_ID=CAMNT_0039119791 /DNA_START=441 /DNA_END=879 /DNA_ORIENTATION=+